MEELVPEWIKFREDDYDDEDDLLQAMIEFQTRKGELNVVDKEWHSVCILKKVQKKRKWHTLSIRYREMF